MSTPAAHKRPPTRASLRDAMIADHDEIADIFDQTVAAFRSGDRDLAAASFTRFEKRLEAHLAMEDSWLLPALAEDNPAEAAALAAEHRAIRGHLTELGIGVDLHLTRATWVEAFVALLREHARREDQLLYQWASVSTRIDAGRALRHLAAV